MRGKLACLLAVLPFAWGCSAASANGLDPNSDLDCALTTYYFHEVAVNNGAPEKATTGLYIFNQWFAAELQHSGRKPSQEDFERLSRKIESDPTLARNELKACTNRASSDGRFNQFAQLMGWHT